MSSLDGNPTHGAREMRIRNSEKRFGGVFHGQPERSGEMLLDGCSRGLGVDR